MRSLFIFLFVLTVSLQAKELTLVPIEIINVIDGDTLVGEIEGETVRVRLKDIDAPEKKQHLEAYNFAKKALTQLTSIDIQYKVLIHGKDHYGRTLGTIYTETSKNINALLVEGGACRYYPRKDNAFRYVIQELDAKKAKRGLWQYQLLAPWDFRKQKR